MRRHLFSTETATMATIGDFINNLAKQAGIPADDKQLIDILSSDAVNTTIPDDLAGTSTRHSTRWTRPEQRHPQRSLLRPCSLTAGSPSS